MGFVRDIGSGDDKGSARKLFKDMSPADVRHDNRFKWALLGVALVLGVLFIAQNLQTAHINFLWFDFRMSLIWVLLIMVALGVGLDRLLIWRSQRRRAGNQ
jgi:uncharacterized integral membrane protein